MKRPNVGTYPNIKACAGIQKFGVTAGKYNGYYVKVTAPCNYKTYKIGALSRHT